MFDDSQEKPLSEPDFTGFYQHSLDAKGRLMIPAPYREKLTSPVYLTHGFDGNLDVYSVAVFTKICTKVEQMNMADPVTRLLRRIYLTGASKLDIDKAGRILIPVHQRNFASIKSLIIVNGVGDHFELWSPENWEKQGQKIQEAMQNPEIFAHLNL